MEDYVQKALDKAAGITDSTQSIAPNSTTVDPSLVINPVQTSGKYLVGSDIAPKTALTPMKEVSKTTLPAAGEANIQGQLDTLSAGDANTAGDIGLANQQKGIDIGNANIKADTAEEQRKIGATWNIQRDQKVAKDEEEVRSQIEAIDKKIADAEGYKFKDFFHDKSLGDKAAGIVMSAFANWGGRLAGRDSNSYIDALNKTIDRDFDMQKADLVNKWEGVKQGRMSLDQKRSIMKDELANAQASYEGRIDAAIKLGESMLAKQGVRTAEIATDKGINALKEKRLTERAKYLKDFRTVQQTTSERTPIDESGSPIMKAKSTEAQKKANEKFGTDYGDWIAQGGTAAMDSKLAKLREARTRLTSEGIAPRIMGALPTGGQDIFTPGTASIRDDVQGAVQETLKQVLGSQFTEKEGIRMMNRAFNPSMSKEENVRRLDDIIKELEAKAEEKKRAAEFYEKTGGITGYQSESQVKPEAAMDVETSTKVDNFMKKNNITDRAKAIKILKDHGKL